VLRYIDFNDNLILFMWVFVMNIHILYALMLHFISKFYHKTDPVNSQKSAVHLNGNYKVAKQYKWIIPNQFRHTITHHEYNLANLCTAVKPSCKKNDKWMSASIEWSSKNGKLTNRQHKIRLADQQLSYPFDLTQIRYLYMFTKHTKKPSLG
jgi:hypothetical protein